MSIFEGYDPTQGTQEQHNAAVTNEETQTQQAEAATESQTETFNASNQTAEPRLSSTQGYAMLQTAQLSAKHVRQVEDGRHTLRDMQMVINFTEVSQEYNLSQPLVAAFKATPGFDQAVKDFPDTALFNIVPEHRSAVNNTAGMESFTEANNSATEKLQSVMQALTATFADTLVHAQSTGANMAAQVARDITALEASDMTDEVLALKSVTALPVVQFNDMLSKLEMYLSNVSAFDHVTLQANPEKIREEVAGLEAVQHDLGAMLGMSLDQYGFRDQDRSTDYTPRPGTYAELGMSVNDVNLLLSRSKAVLEALGTVTANTDNVITSLNTAIAETPATMASNDVTYGARDHITLASCYTTFVAKLVTESVQAVAMALSVADTALDTQSGSF